MIYHFLDIFFLVFHSALILFNSLGWIWHRTRRWNLVTLALTGFSWFVLGIWYGWGYCLCTDWHWQVRNHLGYHDNSNSYIHFLLLKFIGIDFSIQLVNTATVLVFFISVVMSVMLNIRDKKKNAGEFH